MLCATVSLAQSNPNYELVIAKKGTIKLELFAKDAPKTVAHIADLCKKKFYDGILVHRVVPDFVVQAGDPGTKTKGAKFPGVGDGGSGKNIPFETNSHTHETGTLGIALSGARTATGDSQWFINLKPNHRLDGDYCVFGRVTSGMDVVTKMVVGDKIVTMRPVKK